MAEIVGVVTGVGGVVTGVAAVVLQACQMAMDACSAIEKQNEELEAKKRELKAAYIEIITRLNMRTPTMSDCTHKGLQMTDKILKELENQRNRYNLKKGENNLNDYAKILATLQGLEKSIGDIPTLSDSEFYRMYRASRDDPMYRNVMLAIEQQKKDLSSAASSSSVSCSSAASSSSAGP